MMTRWLENWPYKLMAVAIAVILRLYVVQTGNPHNVQTVTVPITLRGLPADLTAIDHTPSEAVQVSGPASRLDGLRPSDIEASVNLSKAKPGVNASLPVAITLAPSYRDLTIDMKTPSAASVTLDQTKSQTMRVNVSFSGRSPIGYRYEPPVADPIEAQVTGPSTVLQSVRQLVVYADASEGSAYPTTIEGAYDIIAVDARGSQVEGVVVAPKDARVTVRVVPTGATKQLVISPKIVGTPAYPNVITQVVVDPSMVTVTGSAALLSATSVIMTKPIDVSSLHSGIRRVVALDLPKGLKSLEEDNVAVAVRVEQAVSSPPQPPVQPVGTLGSAPQADKPGTGDAPSSAKP